MAVPNAADKWWHEAIAARCTARPVKMEKLKMAEILGNNPGFKLLREYWNDGPALQI
ncbi:hypothetical protein [Nostoc sp.]|uniref:hypothetical protein n=1 Tax=Nostoc sp. TaxID=1180 RepID=UPI002FFC4ACD